jgi:hypothetical protein
MATSCCAGLRICRLRQDALTPCPQAPLGCSRADGPKFVAHGRPTYRPSIVHPHGCRSAPHGGQTIDNPCLGRIQYSFAHCADVCCCPRLRGLQAQADSLNAKPSKKTWCLVTGDGVEEPVLYHVCLARPGSALLRCPGIESPRYQPRRGY